MSDSNSIKCSKCDVAIVGPKNPKPDDIFTCPGCGTSERYDKVMEAVKAEFTAMFDKSVKKAFGRPGSGWKLTKK